MDDITKHLKESFQINKDIISFYHINEIYKHLLFRKILKQCNMTYKKLDQLLEKENSKIHNPSLKELSLEKYEIEPEIKNKMSLNDILKNVNAIAEAYTKKEDILKIFEYHNTALHAKNLYDDILTYNYLRRKCIDTFNSIKGEKIKEKITKIIEPEFLNYKK